MKAAIHIRVSTAQQIDKDSLHTQEELLKQYCRARDFGIFRIYRDEGISAKDKKRPSFEALLKDASRKKFNYVIATRLDRITRSLKDLIDLMDFFQKHDIKIVSLNENIDTEGPMGRFVTNLLGAIAQLKREIDAERVSTDMHFRAMKGKWNGGIIPYGYITREKLVENLIREGMSKSKAIEKANKETPKSKKLYVNKQEAKLIRHIFDSYLSNKSLKRVINDLNTSGHKTRKGLWTTTTVRRVLTNPFYLGYITYGKRKADIATGRMHGFTHKKKLSSGKFREYVYYRCSTSSRKGASACKGQTIEGQPIENIVVDSILKISGKRAFLTEKEKLLKQLRESIKPENRDIEN
ncbi:MAG: recombinase family protein [bacterium]